MLKMVRLFLLGSIFFAGVVVANQNAETVRGKKCDDIKIINETDEWTEFDARMLKLAPYGCVRKFSKDHCLSLFKKVEKKMYVALCRKNGN